MDLLKVPVEPRATSSVPGMARRAKRYLRQTSQSDVPLADSNASVRRSAVSHPPAPRGLFRQDDDLDDLE
jgi:hypothetical protein